MFGSFIFIFISLIDEIDSRLPKNQNTGIFGGSPFYGINGSPFYLIMIEGENTS